MLYTVREVAKVLKVTPEAVKRWINKGDIKASIVGNRIPRHGKMRGRWEYRIGQEEYDRLTKGS